MAIDTLTEGDFTIEIDVDQDPLSPRDDYAPGCSLVMWGRHWNFPNDAGIEIGGFDGWPQIEAHLLNEGTALYSQPVWVYEHSGITLRTAPGNPFHCPWDSAQCGVAYVTAKDWKECQGTEWTGSDEDKEQAAKMITLAVEQYGYYVNGECYSYTVLDADGNEVAGCSGYYGFEDVETCAREAAKAAAE